MLSTSTGSSSRKCVITPMTADVMAMYREYAKAHRLLTSSGSDSHGLEKKPIKYRAELSQSLLERLGIQIS
jgi:hypothetical protein